MGCFMLLDNRGRKFFVPDSKVAVRVEGLGVVDPGNFTPDDVGGPVLVAGKKFILFRPTLSDMMLSLERGPQIIMEKDASVIAHYMNLGCGSVVLEIGAGSGSMAIQLLHAVGAQGAVVTLDNRLEHLKVASSNVSRFGLRETWHPVVADGRMHVGSVFADAACIDIPDPWNAISSCWHALRPGGMLASYSPTVNQTEKTVISAKAISFTHELSFEVLMRRLDVSEGATRHSFEGPGHTGYISVFRKVNANK